jgi:hypothetical protein
MPPKQAPVFQGLPSPSLKKMRRMSRDELQEHINKLNEHAKIIREKMDRQKEHPHPPSPLRARNMRRQLHRLEQLAEAAEHILHEGTSSGYSRRSM